MGAAADSALDNLAAFVEAIAGDPKLRERFRRLARMSPTQRFNEIQIMAHRMAAEGEERGRASLTRSSSWLILAVNRHPYAT
jgi:hypothetical protein